MIRGIALAAAPILAGWASVAQCAVAVADGDRLWRERAVSYTICESVEAPGEPRTRGCDQGGKPLGAVEAAKVREAVGQWNAMFSGHLRFVQLDGLRRSQRGVLFSRSARDTACSTDTIGRPRAARRTNVKLGAHCNAFASTETPVGTILHEMMHVAGFYHEHQRPDRDAFLRARVGGGLVSFLFDIGGAAQWMKASSKRMRALGPYDFRSIMHYPVEDPKKAELTLEGLQRLEAQGLARTDPGRRDAMSAEDVAGIKLLYGGDAALASRHETAPDAL